MSNLVTRNDLSRIQTLCKEADLVSGAIYDIQTNPHWDFGIMCLNNFSVVPQNKQKSHELRQLAIQMLETRLFEFVNELLEYGVQYHYEHDRTVPLKHAIKV